MNDLYLTNTRSIRSRTLSDMETAPLLPCGSGNFAPTAIRRYPIGQGSTYKKRKLSIGLWFMAVSMGGEKRKRGQMSDIRKRYTAWGYWRRKRRKREDKELTFKTSRFCTLWIILRINYNDAQHQPYPSRMTLGLESLSRHWKNWSNSRILIGIRDGRGRTGGKDPEIVHASGASPSHAASIAERSQIGLDQELPRLWSNS